MRDNLLPGVPIVENPFFEDFVGDFDPETARIARDLHENGYAVFDFPDPDFSGKAEAIIERMRPKYAFEDFRSGKVESFRTPNAWKTDADIKSIATNPKLIALLSKLYGRRAIPWQTLTFPVGSQQPGHSDHVYFNSVPERFMCGVWAALEDVDENNGPLFYYPGSHKGAAYGNEHIGFDWRAITRKYPNEQTYVRLWDALCERRGLERRQFQPKRGQAVIWCSTLVHGGAAHRDLARTRWSQVTHYFFEGCAYTKPISNDVFARQMVDIKCVNIATGKRERSRLARATPLRARLKARTRWWEWT